MIVIKKIVWIFFFFIFIFIGICIFLLNTNTGMYLVCTGVTCCIPGLTFNSVSGNWKNFNINHIEYCISSGTVVIDRCNIILNYKYIFDKQMQVDFLYLKDVFINIKNTDITKREVKKNKIIQMNNIFSFFNSLIFKHIILSNTRVISDNVMLELEELENIGIDLHNRSLLKILPTHVKGIFLNFVTANVLNIKTDITNICQFYNSQNINSILKNLSKKLSVILFNFKVPLDFLIEEIQGQDLYIFGIDDNQHKISNICLKMSVYDQTSNIYLDVDSSYGHLNVISYVVLKEHWPINITANYIAYNDSINGNKNNNKNNQNINKINLLITGDLFSEICLCCDFFNVVSMMHILLKIRMTQIGISMNISIIGSKIPIFFLKKNRFMIEEINFCLNGTMCDYHMRMTSQVSNVKGVLRHIVMNARGNFSECVISKLTIGTLKEYFELKGIINWDNMVSWNSILTVHKVNIFRKLFKYPIELSGMLTVHGCLHKDKWSMTVSNINIHGYVKDNHILCTGSLHRSISGEWTVPALSIVWGPNTITMKGELVKEYVFDLIFKIPKCNSIIPVLNGSIYGQCKVRGSITHPILFLKINLDSLCWSDKKFFVKRLIFNSKIVFHSNIPSDFFIDMNTIRYGMFSLHKLIVNGQGNLKLHCVNITSYNDQICCGKFKFFGNFNLFHKIWNGKICKTKINTPIGDWKLIQDIDVTYKYLEQKIIFGSHYWESTNCCIPIYDIYRSNILQRINTICKRIDNTMCLHSDMLPKEINVDIVRIRCVNCYWMIGKILPRGTILLSVRQLNIIFNNGINKIVANRLNSVNVKVISSAVDVLCQWDSSIDDSNQMYGMFKLSFLYNNKDFNIIGNVNIRNVPLEFFSNLFFQSDECVHGLLNLSIRFFGPIYSAKIYGFIELKNITFNKFDVPFSVKNGKLTIKFFKDYAFLNGMIEVDHEKYLYLNGNIVNTNSIHDMRIFLKVQGNQIDFCISPKIKLKISPDIICTITAEKMYIEGSIDVPWACIVAQEFFKKDTVGISMEEIVLDDNFKPILENPKNSLNFISSNIIVNLGNDVNFNGFGFYIKLRGSMTVGYNKSGLMLTGNIDIPFGSCMVYGHHLTIKKGQLLFYGEINQPYLDIEAVCSPSSSVDKVIGGIRIIGPINQPKLEISPNSSLLTKQEIVSYLLGNNSVILSYMDTNMIASLLIGAGVSHGEKFINKIGKIFGVQDLTLNTQNISTTPLVELSGFIAPGLQIKYGIGIFDLLTTITVRYCLSPRFYLEAVSGNCQAFDLLYQFDF